MDVSNLVDGLAVSGRRLEAYLLGDALGLFVQSVSEPVYHAQHFDFAIRAELDLERDLALNLQLPRLFGILGLRLRKHLGSDKVDGLRFRWRSSTIADAGRAKSGRRDAAGCARPARCPADGPAIESGRGDGSPAGPPGTPLATPVLNPTPCTTPRRASPAP